MTANGAAGDQCYFGSVQVEAGMPCLNGLLRDNHGCVYSCQLRIYWKVNYNN